MSSASSSDRKVDWKQPYEIHCNNPTTLNIYTKPIDAAQGNPLIGAIVHHWFGIVEDDIKMYHVIDYSNEGVKVTPYGQWIEGKDVKQIVGKGSAPVADINSKIRELISKGYTPQNYSAMLIDGYNCQDFINELAGGKFIKLGPVLITIAMIMAIKMMK